MELKKRHKDLPVSTKSSVWPLTTKGFLRVPKPLFVFALFFLAWAVSATIFWHRDHKVTILQTNQIQGLQSDIQRRLDSEITLHQINDTLEKALYQKDLEIRTLTKEKSALQKQLAEIQRLYRELHQRFYRFWERKSGKESGLLTKEGDQPGIQVEETADQSEIPTQKNPLKEDDPNVLQGHVLEMNPVYGFAIVDLGRNSGLRKGDTLLLLRQGIPVEGRLWVERLYENISAAQFQLDDPQETPLIGDSVIRPLDKTPA